MEPVTIIILAIAFIVFVGIAFYLGHKIGGIRKDIQWEKKLPGHRQDAINRSRAVLAGHFSEQLAPYLPDFNFNPSECKFIGKPIDFLVFKGLDEGKVDEVVFVEVKSGKSKLSSKEKSVKEAVENKKVRWEEYRVPDFKDMNKRD